MKLEDLKVIILHEKNSDSYCAYFDKLKGIVVQVDNPDNIIPELLKSIEVMLHYAKDKGLFITHELDFK